MQKSVYGEDLHILLQLFQLPTDDVVICDPVGLLRGTIPSSFKRIDCPQRIPRAKVIVNLSGRKITLASFDFLLEFGKKGANLENNNTTTLNYICNPDGSMRWLFPKASRRPGFLNLYNGNSWKAKLYRRVIQTAFRLGAQSFFLSGSFYLYSKQENYLQQLFGEEYSIFTGTVGQNRKGIIALQTDKTEQYFLKVPLSEASQQLVDNEEQQLRALQGVTGKVLQIPTVARQANAVRLSNIRPLKVQGQKDLTPVHLNALRELYVQTKRTKSLQDLTCWTACEEQLTQLKTIEKTNNGLALITVQELTHQLHRLKNELDPQQKIAVAHAHGDFTPWNMYLSKDQLHVYDWELSCSEMPLWYDAFHFLFQQHILIQRSNFSTIHTAMEQFKHQLTTEEQASFTTHYQLYLLLNCSYYLSLYAFQIPLHMQAHWLVNTWTEAVQALLQSPAPSRTTVNLAISS